MVLIVAPDGIDIALVMAEKFLSLVSDIIVLLRMLDTGPRPEKVVIVRTEKYIASIMAKLKLNQK